MIFRGGGQKKFFSGYIEKMTKKMFESIFSCQNRFFQNVFVEIERTHQALSNDVKIIKIGSLFAEICWLKVSPCFILVGGQKKLRKLHFLSAGRPTFQDFKKLQIYVTLHRVEV